MKGAQDFIPTTVSISAANHSRQMFETGQKIKLGRNSWFMSFRRVKNKMMIHRLLRKEYCPYMKVVGITDGIGGTTLTVKPFNF